MTEEIKNHILAVRQTGATNMFDIIRVREIAKELDFDELVEHLPASTGENVNCILYGK